MSKSRNKYALLTILIAFITLSSGTIHANESVIRDDLQPRNPPAQDIPRFPRCVDDPDTIYPCEIIREWDVEELEERAQPFWVEDETTFVITYQGQAERAAIVGEFSIEISRVADSDWWAIALRIPRLDEAIISIGILPLINGRWRIDSVVLESYRGPNAPAEPELADPLKGRLYTAMLTDNFIRNRQVTVYLPPDHDPEQSYPVVYMTDGGAVDRLGPTIEPYILDGALPPLILVGVHSAEPLTRNDNPRADEYLPGWEGGEVRFSLHERFFVQTVIPWAEETLGASTDREDRAVFGFSNGAAFAAYIGQNYPEIFGNNLTFSLNWLIQWQEHEEFPVRHYLVAGTLEPHFHIQTKIWYEQLVDEGDEAFFTDWAIGHNFEMWQGEFPKALIWLFGDQDKPL